MIPTQQVKHDTHAYLHKQHVASIADSPVYGVRGQLYPPAAHRLQIYVIAVLWIIDSSAQSAGYNKHSISTEYSLSKSS